MYLEDGSEQEFFPNERLEIVLDVIKQYVQDHPNELRRVDILNSILGANMKFANKATIFGGIILICIGIEIFVTGIF